MAVKTSLLIDALRYYGESLPLTIEAFDTFNRDIQAEILKAERLDPALAIQLAQLKLDINKRIYNAQRA